MGDTMMMTSTSSKCRGILAAASMVAALVAHGQALEAPKFQVVDKFGVNIANGQVTHSLTTVSIGGAMGLSHSISMYANHMDMYEGFKDKFKGGGENIGIYPADPNMTPQYIYRVHDFADSADFAYMSAGVMQKRGDALAPGYTYSPIGDQRHILEVKSGYLEWTKPDGTVVTLNRPAGNAATAPAQLTEIKYPNGFTISVYAGGLSVLTNTGFQIKRVHESDTRPLNKQNKSWVNGASSGWSTFNPKYVHGINNAVEYCSPSATCSLTRDWPKATFTYPPGMPRTMYLNTNHLGESSRRAFVDGSGQSVVYDDTISVLDWQGGTTDFYYRAEDLALHENGTVAPGQTADREFSPRIVGIKPANSTRVRYTYKYKNNFATTPLYDYRLDDAGVVREAKSIDLVAAYEFRGMNVGSQPVVNTASGPNGVSRVEMNVGSPLTLQGTNGSYPGTMQFAQGLEGTMWYEGDARNFPSGFNKIQPPSEQYRYDGRGNLDRITYGPPTSQVYTAAGYDIPCTSSTRKICNQATWVEDANRNRTEYAYHAESGQVEKITYPANKRGVKAQTRYSYAPRSARYYTAAGSKNNGPPIWLKIEESYCINSAADSSGNCALNDEVVTRYEYNHDNLLLTSMAITDPSGKTLRTCYQYDIYGNQIGKTEPKGAAGGCN